MTVCAGVDGCRGGWIAVWRHPGAAPTVTVFEKFGDLLMELPNDAIIAVDIPIGLPKRIQGKGRVAEQTVRPLLPGKASSGIQRPIAGNRRERHDVLCGLPVRGAFVSAGL